MKTIYAALLASALMPMTAYAQGTSPSTPPATPPASTATPAPDAGAAKPATPDASASKPADSSTAAGKTAAPSSGSSTSSSDATAPAKTDTSTASASSSGDSGPFVTVPPTDAWRTSDLEGKDVYGADNKSIGEITDVIVSKDGKVTAVLVGVGGFLGIGQKDVAVSMSALQFGPGKTEGLEKEADTSNAAPSTGGMGASTGMTPSAGTATPAAAPESAETKKPVVGKDNLPDHIVLNVTRDQLENAPAYGGNDNGSNAAAPSGASTSGMAPATPSTTPAAPAK